MGVNEKMTAIADSIREKTGGTGKLSLDQMATSIGEVYEAGQKDILRAFTNNYTRTEWQYAFRRSDFSGITFPKKVNVTNCTQMFANYGGQYLPIGFDFSAIGENKSLQHMCRYAEKLKEFPDMDILAQADYNGTWQSCYALETIENISCNENTLFSASFSGCQKLKNVTFDGLIGQDISFADCKDLSKGSIEDMIQNHLSAIASGKTLTLSSNAVVSAFGSTTATEWTSLVAQKPSGWTITLV